MRDEGITQYRQDGSMAELAGVIAIDRKDSAPPELVRALPRSDWREVQNLGFNRYYANTVIVADNAASDGAAARLDGSEGGWLIQLKHHKLPEEGLWDIYADVRVDADGAVDKDIALGIGSTPPMNNCRNVTVGELRHGAYRLVKAPGGPFRYDQNDQVITYVRGGGAKSVKYIYVDRFIFVRAKESSGP